MEILFQILITLLAWIVLSWLSINLCGMVIRGLFVNRDLVDLQQNGNEFIKKEASKGILVEFATTITSLVILSAFMYALYHYFNLGVVVASLMVMISRLPEQFIEARKGIPASKNTKTEWDFITPFFFFASLPLLWFSLYYW